MKKFKYKMTIIMPSYNNGQYIRQALDSILMQETDFNYQIIVTDDCSQDGSPQIIAEYEKKYPERILALYSERNCRLFRNVLKALKRMDSEYFCVLDPDDYWTDSKHLKKAVVFLDNNPDYTIYGANLYKIFNDGSVEMKYNRPGMDKFTSTYIDYVNGKAVLSTTASSVYRNVYFSDGIPQEFLDVMGTQFEEMFRADSARNLIHLKRGKAYFVNEFIGYYRYHEKGLASSVSEYEKDITCAFANIGFYNFFGQENEKEYVSLIKKIYTEMVKNYLSICISGRIPMLSEQYREYLEIVIKWLQEHEAEDETEIRIPFSLKKYGEMAQKKIIIWGTGSGARKVIEQYNIPVRTDTIFVDNSQGKQGTEFMGKIIKAPEVIREEKDAFVVIASIYYKEIIKQIRMQKLCTDDRIINIYDYKEHWVE